MSYPGSIVTGFDLAKLVLADFIESALIGDRIVLDWNLCRHAAHGVNPAAMAGLNQQIDVGLQEMFVHGQGRAIGLHEFRAVSEFLDDAKDVVPSAAVQSGRMIAQFI